MKILKALRDFFPNKELKKGKCCAIALAGGRGRRMECEETKQFLPLGGIPLLAHTLIALNNAKTIDAIVIVCCEDELVPISDLIKDFDISKAKTVTKGGDTRQESVYSGLLEVTSEYTYVAVHDGARPFADPKLIDSVVKDAMTYGAAAAAVPVIDTIKRVDSEGFSAETLDRQNLYAIQTPQVFDAGILKTALKKVLEEGILVTDDAMAVEHLGVKVYISQGDYNNIKITVPSDLNLAEMILESRG